MRITFVLIAALILATSMSGWAVTATYIWDDFNGAYNNDPTDASKVVENQFSNDMPDPITGFSCAYNYEQEPGPPDEYNTGRQLPPHTGADSCQRFRVYRVGGDHGWWSGIRTKGDTFPGSDCEIDLVNLAQGRRWLPIDLTNDITVSISVWGNNSARLPSIPQSEFYSQIDCIKNNGAVYAPLSGSFWPAGAGSYAAVDWNTTTNNTWQTLSVVLHPADLVAGRRCGIMLINGVGRRFPPYSGEYFTYWGEPTGAARSTTLWENLSLTYTVTGPLPTTIGVAKSKADGTPVNLTGKVVTAVFPLGADNRVFIEEPDRCAAISVIPKEGVSPPAANTKCDVTGHIETDDQTNERYIADAEFGAGTSQELKPIAIGNASLGGVGIVSHGAPSDRGVGVDNTGMLVTAYGRIIAMSDASDLDSGNCFYIDDGSNVAADYHWYLDGGTWNKVTQQEKGVKVYSLDASYLFSVGQYVSVTGVLGLRATDALNPPPAHGIKYRAIYTRALGDDVIVVPEH